ANQENTNHHQVVTEVASLKRSAGNVVLLNAGNDEAGNGQLKYDASISKGSADNYKIIYKGNVKIGIITGAGPASEINLLASRLKKDQKCHLVVCLSQRGYKLRTGNDDISLAGGSQYLDIIIGGDPKNCAKNPVVVLNKDNAEVIIDHAASAASSLGKIAVTVNDRGQKFNIAFS
ncbi:MAG TPA: hypothetical protein VKH37_10535, partial [Ferruginibacter sp.]|nr:hypothetical protein [Ferruginibacter sp.]